MDEREQALLKAVRGLCIEIEGIWDAFEYGLRNEISNTNYTIVRDKIEETRAAIIRHQTIKKPTEAQAQALTKRAV